MGKHNAYSSHHIIPKSQGGSNERINLKSVKEKFHIDFHKVFKNMTPDEQYQFLVNFNEKVHTKQFKKEFTDLINSANYDDWMYNKGTRIREKNNQQQLFV